MVSSRGKRIRPALGLGTRVRVKSHIMDPDFPELPLGGWRGEVTEVQQGTARNCLVRWSRDTLARIQALYRRRCEEDDLSVDLIWLMEEDLEPDSGGA